MSSLPFPSRKRNSRTDSGTWGAQSSPCRRQGSGNSGCRLFELPPEAQDLAQEEIEIFHSRPMITN
jgi:hypothetical protein